jgi:23S rRNA pseudoU1915 N3-methylase RlmH
MFGSLFKRSSGKKQQDDVITIFGTAQVQQQRDDGVRVVAFAVLGATGYVQAEMEATASTADASRADALPKATTVAAKEVHPPSQSSSMFGSLFKRSSGKKQQDDVITIFGTAQVQQQREDGVRVVAFAVLGATGYVQAEMEILPTTSAAAATDQPAEVPTLEKAADSASPPEKSSSWFGSLFKRVVDKKQQEWQEVVTIVTLFGTAQVQQQRDDGVRVVAFAVLGATGYIQDEMEVTPSVSTADSNGKDADAGASTDAISEGGSSLASTANTAKKCLEEKCVRKTTAPSGYCGICQQKVARRRSSAWEF